jgi:thiamine transport system substrate-binding protein
VISNEHIVDRDFHVTPYAYGNMGILYDEAQVAKAPDNFGELQDSRYFHQLLVPDASRSGIGQAMLCWSVAAFGESGYQSFWQSIRKNVSEFTPSWSAARQKFRQDDNFLMLGFTTTPAYYSEILHYDGIHCLVPKEGSFVYIPVAGLIRKAKHDDMGRKFLDFMISEQFQKFVPFTQYIYPIDRTIEMPLSFSFAPLAVYTLNNNITTAQLQTNLPEWLTFWQHYLNFY